MIELDPLDKICATFGAITSGGVEGMDADGLERAAVLARRLRELTDRLEVHVLGALDESKAASIATRPRPRTGSPSKPASPRLRLTRRSRPHGS